MEHVKAERLCNTENWQFYKRMEKEVGTEELKFSREILSWAAAATWREKRNEALLWKNRLEGSNIVWELFQRRFDVATSGKYSSRNTCLSRFTSAGLGSSEQRLLKCGVSDRQRVTGDTLRLGINIRRGTLSRRVVIFGPVVRSNIAMRARKGTAPDSKFLKIFRNKNMMLQRWFGFFPIDGAMSSSKNFNWSEINFNDVAMPDYLDFHRNSP